MSSVTNDSVPTPVRTARVIAITSAAWLSGAIAWISYAIIPTVRFAPAPIKIKQWKYQFDIGAGTAPYFAIASGLSFSYLMTQRKTP
ncbi:hypothetical protein B0J12DRAFT_748525 [Macrophomina phaseolina]|uniref:Uncharacterized protein n=1 Tax=Macrophomina phaseolina TaxID=35725 RepID=A0ABQ8GWV0_9PEZI|nr:hypothetical protein B0J12DRAFT_748525 [Macrophomina phaseolina]